MTDRTGEPLWVKSYGGPGNEYGGFVRETPRKTFIVATQWNNPNTNGWLLEIVPPRDRF